MARRAPHSRFCAVAADAARFRIRACVIVNFVIPGDLSLARRYGKMMGMNRPEPTKRWSVPAHGRTLAREGDALSQRELLRLLPHLRSKAELSDARRNGTARKRSHALTSQERTLLGRSAEVRAQLRAGQMGARETFVSEPEPVALVLSAAAKHAAKKRARAAAVTVAPNAALAELHRRQAERAAMTAGTSSYRSTAS